MEEIEFLVNEFINSKIRPRTRVDGGDILMEKVEGGTVYIGAYAECSTCRCCEQKLNRWIEKELKNQFSLEINVKIIKHIPYFAL